MEIWKEIGFSDGKYLVSNYGRIKSAKTGRILHQHISHNGYFRVGLQIKGVRKFYHVHRLVGAAFVENPNNFPQINHKDENRRNNYAENLEWCTSSYNCSYGGRTVKLKKKIGYRVEKYSENGEFISTYLSVNDAAKDIGGEWHGIKDACDAGRLYHGFLWRLDMESPALKRYQHQ